MVIYTVTWLAFFVRVDTDIVIKLIELLFIRVRNLIQSALDDKVILQVLLGLKISNKVCDVPSD